MRLGSTMLFQKPIVRYLFSIAAVAITFGLRIWLIPVTGIGAPFVLFFAVVLATSWIAGIGPAICTVLLSMPLAAYTFVVSTGYYSLFQAAFQSLLFAVDGIFAIYLTSAMNKGREAVQEANRRLLSANDKIT